MWAGNYKIANDGIDGETYASPTYKTSYHANSVIAYNHDKLTANAVFGKQYMGLTAASTVSKIQPNGFIDYGNYLGKQGSNKNMSPEGEVVQLAPAPYGAVLALPFKPDAARAALQEYVNLGYYHEFMGLPDNIVIKNIGDKKILPNWQQKDINIAPIAMAIDQVKNKTIATTYLKDKYARDAYIELYSSFENDYNNGVELNYRSLNNEDVKIAETKLGNFSAFVYPNPTSGNFVLRMNIVKPGNYQGYIIDVNGRVIHEVTWKFNEVGLQDLPINDLKDKGLIDGVYFFKVIGLGENVVIPVIISKD